jgi:outer membrane receptor protein involved in Fe transport
LPSSAIESVAITRGPASVLQGPNALSGAVNVISRRVESQGWNRALAANAGQEWRSIDGFLGHRRGRHSFSAALGWSESDGFEAGGEDTLVTGSDFRNRSAVLGWGFRYADESTIGMTFLAVDNSKGVTPERTASNPRFWHYPELERNQLIAFGRHALDSSAVDYSVFLARSSFRIDQFTDSTYTVISNVEDGRDRAEGARVQWSKPLTPNQDLVIGLDWSQSEHLFRERASSSSFTPFSQVLSQLAVEWHHSAGPWEFLLGAAYEHSNTPDTGTLPDPGSRNDWAATGAVTYDLSPALSLDFTLGRKTRFPSLRESFNGALGRFVVNPDLGPETAVTAAVGVVGRHPDLYWELRGFATEIEDGITRVSLPGGLFTRTNLTSSRISGVEFGVDAKLTDWLEARVEGTLLNARAEDPTGSYEDHMEYRPGVNLGSEFTFRLPSNWLAIAGVRYIAEEHGLHPSSPMPQKLPSYVHWSLSFERELTTNRLGEFAFRVRLENAFDEYYETQWGLPGPGRRASIGFTWSD